MIVCVCVDDAMGMSFNKKRLSRDSKIYERLAELASGKQILMRQYSQPLFSETQGANVIITEDFSEATDSDICFFELDHLTEYSDKINGYILYRWNRRYPSDKKFPFDLEKKGFVMTEQTDFAGSSHDNITEEIWIKK